MSCSVSMMRVDVVLMVVMVMMSSWLPSSKGDTCTIKDIQDIQPAINVMTGKLDGHWYVSKVFGGPSGDQFASYTVDLVPTLPGYALFSNTNNSANSACVYQVTEYKATTQSSYIFSTSGIPTATKSSILLVGAADTDVQHVLLFLCEGQGVMPSDVCVNPVALLAGKQPRQGAAADVWLASLTSPLSCFPSPGVAVPEIQECPMKPMWTMPGRVCDTSTFTVQANFNSTKYMEAPWLEMTYLATSFEEKITFYTDYIHDYFPLANGSIVANISARDPLDNNKCLFYHRFLSTTNTPGKLILHDPIYGPVPYNVIATDYAHYSLVFGCFNMTSTGLCRRAHSWLWSRDVTLARSYIVQANSQIMDMCVNPAAWFFNTHDNPCVKPTGGSSSLHSVTTWMAVMVMLVVSITP